MSAGTDILIVEDSPTQAEALKALLEDNGHATRIAPNGRQALVMARCAVPTLIISDLLMPEMDGYALCKALKADEALRGIPVVLLTSLTGPQELIKGLECGADTFIAKPYDEDYLLARIDSLLTNLDLRKSGKSQSGIEIDMGGQRHFITAERRQILDLLISTYGEAVHLNQKLMARQAELERSHQMLQGLYHIADGLNRCRIEQEVVETVLEGALKLPGVQAGWIFLREGDSGFRTVSARGAPSHLPSQPGTHHEPCSCQRMALDDEFCGAARMVECERMEAARGGLRGLRCHASVPLRQNDRVIGILNLVGRDLDRVKSEELQVLYAVGNQVAIALERALLNSYLANQVEERTKALRAEITEREQAEAALRTSVELFHTLARVAPVGIFRTDAEGRCTYVNERWAEITGLTSEQTLGLGWIQALHPEDRERVFEEWQRSRQKSGRFEAEYRLQRSPGTLTWVLGQAIPELDRDGGMVGFVGTLTDITQRRQLEAQFQQAQKMEAIGQLTGGIAHDFNNMLTAINGFSELLMSEMGRDDPLRHGLEQIQYAGERAASLTRQLLVFSRKQVVAPKVLDLNEVIANMEKLLKRLIGEDVILVSCPAANLWCVKADPAQIEQVIMNLAVNARDAMPNGGRVTIETRNVELDAAYARLHIETRSGPYVLLAVSDTGCGMDAQLQRRIFEPFFTTKEPGKGTGLGLSTVFGIVKQSGGALSVYSEPDKGTTFKVYLPRVLEVPDYTPPQEASPDAMRGTETILVAEDEDVVRGLARTVLEPRGYRVLEARDGTQALQIGREYGPTIHLLLTDTVMPGMSGRELAEHLTAARPGLKVLYMSGYTDRAIVQHGVLEAGLSFLQKPFKAHLLASKVREVLDGPPAPPSTDGRADHGDES